MIKIEFTEEEMKALDYERYHHPHPRVQREMEALWLKSQNVSHGNRSLLNRRFSDPIPENNKETPKIPNV